MRNPKDDEVQCPSCNWIHNTETTSQMLFNTDALNKCGLVVVCENCEMEFELRVDADGNIETSAI